MSYRDVRKDFRNICVISVIVKKKVKISNITITTKSTIILCLNSNNSEKYTSNCILI